MKAIFFILSSGILAMNAGCVTRSDRVKVLHSIIDNQEAKIDTSYQSIYHIIKEIKKKDTLLEEIGRAHV